MLKRYLLGLAALLLGAIAIYALVIAPAMRDAQAADDTWTTTRVIDGDTIEVRKGNSPALERVRLAGIDTPERGQCGAQEATDRLTRLIAKNPQGLVRLLPSTKDGSNDRDRYDRLIRYVITDADETTSSDAGYVLIKEGFAIARYDSRDGYPRHSMELAYQEADEASPPAVSC